MAAQIVVIKTIVIKYHGNNENGCKMFAVVCPPEITEKNNFISF